MNRYFYKLIPALFAVLAAGCSETLDNPVSSEDTGDGLYLKLSLSVSGATRSNPSGGEIGDGTEGGIRRENEIENLALFFYEGENGPDSPDDTPLLHYEIYDGLTLSPGDGNTVSHVVRVPQYGMRDGHRVVVAANFSGDPESVRTLGELRRMIVAQPWRSAASVKDYSRFAMSTASGNAPYDGRIHFFDEYQRPVEGTRDDPFYMRAEIERAAARIDFMFDNVNMAGLAPDGLLYDVESGSEGGDNGTLHISHILPVNVMSEGTFLLKHVTKGETDMDSRIVCGDESTDAESGRPLNYVVEPHSVHKTGATGDDIAVWYGATSADNVRKSPELFFTEASHIRGWLSSDIIADCSDGFDKTMTLAYVNENTQHKDLHDSRFMTGLAIRGIFLPASVYSDAQGTQDLTYKKGDTFWRYSPTTAEMEKESLYFSTRESAEDYAASHPEDVAEITEYAGGVCYYNLWIRHAGVERNGGEYDSWPMEYGIVRNNIYRIGVSFSGIGSPVPDLREPHNIRTRIFVRKWNFRRQPTIIM